MRYNGAEAVEKINARGSFDLPIIACTKHTYILRGDKELPVYIWQ